MMKPGVSFKGVEWEVEKEKSERRRQRRPYLKKNKRNTEIPIPTMDEKIDTDWKLRRFLDAATNTNNELGEAEKATTLLESEEARFILESRSSQKFSANENTFLDLTLADVDRHAKAKHIIDNWESAKEKELLNIYLTGWMLSATENRLYVDPPQSPSNKSTKSNSSLVSGLSDDSGLNPIDPVALKEIHDLYNDTIRLTYLKGLLIGLSPDLIQTAVENIFQMQKGVLNSLDFAKQMALEDAQRYVDEWYKPREDDRQDIEKNGSEQQSDMHTISSRLSESEFNLLAFSTSFVSRKTEGWETSKIENFTKYCYRKGKKPR